MKFLSIDLEATGLEEDALIIEFAMIPFNAATQEMAHALTFHCYIKCPSFADLKDSLNPWVVENNKELIDQAHKEGISLALFKEKFQTYLESEDVQEYFAKKKVMLFGKSLSAIDLPFLNRDLGWEWMNKYFHHRNFDLSSYAVGLVAQGLLPKGGDSGEFLMKYFKLGDVAHTALADSINTAKLLFKIQDHVNKQLRT